MQKSASKLLHSLSLARAGLAPALAFILLGATAPWLAAQSSNFNTSEGGTNDIGWTRWGIAGYLPTYSFPPDGSGGYAYRIYTPPTGTTNYPALGGSYRADVTYTNRFSAGVDLLTWNTTWNPYAGLLFYGQDISTTNIEAYAALYSPNDENLYIEAVYSIANDPIPYVFQVAALSSSVVVDPTRGCRLVASSHDGYTFLLQLFDRSQTNSPWASAICQIPTYFPGGTIGPCGLFVLESEASIGPDDSYLSWGNVGADATYDNYVAFAPATNAMPATVTALSPLPAGKATDLYPTVTVEILNRDTTVVTNSIVLCLDGAWIPNASLTIVPQVERWSNPSNFGGPTNFGGATVTYPITSLLPWGSTHTNRVAFLDSTNIWQTNTWTWTTAYPYLFQSNSLPLGSLSVRGFDARMVQSSAANIAGSGGIPNSVASAKAVLAYQYAVDQAATNIVQQVAWDLNASAYGAVTNFPGLCIPPANVNSYAIETLAYLQLTAGTYTFYVDSDDAVGIYSGTNLTDTSMVLLQSSGVIHTAFDFIVAAGGLYPFHVIYEEGGGAAYLVLSSVNNGVNTLLNAAGGVNAFYPLVCKSSTSVKGPYTVDAAANAGNALTTASVLCDGGGAALNQKVTGGTLTVPISGAPKFYRLDGPRSTKFTNITRVGSNVVITYQAN